MSRSLVQPSKLSASAASQVRPASLLHFRQMKPETVRRPPSAAGMMCSLERSSPLAESPQNTHRLAVAAMFFFTSYSVAEYRNLNNRIIYQPLVDTQFHRSLTLEARVESTMATISHVHAAAGTEKTDNPVRHQVVAETIKAWRNQAPAPRQADALT